MVILVLCALLLGGEAIQLDEDLLPRFTEQQVSSSPSSVREGFAKWAATSEGRTILVRLSRVNAEITVIEDSTEKGPGRAPQPAIGTILAAADPTKLKRYELILNPALAQQYERGGDAIALGEPTTPAEVMAAAWAAEMLHIDFYARGIPLPHHDRPEFQQRWHRVAEQLGFPLMRHTTDRY
jgi:hypothetical protein